MDNDPQAAARFYSAVRSWSESASVITTGVIRYETKPDEQYDLSKVSNRVYGRRCEILTIMAAAGINSIDQKLRQQTLILPSEGRLMQIKRNTGFESNPDYRSNGAPTWSSD